LSVWAIEQIDLSPYWPWWPRFPGFLSLWVRPQIKVGMASQNWPRSYLGWSSEPGLMVPQLGTWHQAFFRKSQRDVTVWMSVKESLITTGFQRFKVLWWYR
jgi:hypothetical protein